MQRNDKSTKMKDSVCRLCLAVLVDPDDSGCSVINDQFRQALENVFTFEIRLEEDLPVHTCKQCSWNVLDFQSYSELVKNNQKKLEKGLLLNVQNKATIGGDTVSTDVVFNDNINVGKITRDCETLNSSQLSEGSNPADANTTPTGNELSLDDVEVAYEIHPDHDSSSVQEEVSDQLCPEMFCEEYLITSCETEDSNDERTFERDILPAVEDENHSSDADEPSRKKKKISTPGGASTRQNKLANDSYKAPSNVCLNIHQKDVDVLHEQTNEMHPCEQCEKKFLSKWELDYHKQEHIVLECPFCQEIVPAKTLNSHIATHQDAFRCSTCKKKFINQRDFKYHKGGCKKHNQYVFVQAK